MTTEKNMTTTTDGQESNVVSVSEETKALVEQRMIDEPDEIKQKMGELVELIKKRAELEIQSTENLTREKYIQAMNQAKDTLKKTENFFEDQQKSVEQYIKEMDNRAIQEWENFVGDIKKMGDRVDRAIEAAWQSLTKPEAETPSESDSQ